MKPYIEIGEVVSLHGVAGEMKLYPWADSADALVHLKKAYLTADGGEQVQMKARVHKDMLLLKLSGVDTLEDARAYLKRTFYAARGDLPLAEGRFFVQDLLGCRVENEDSGEVYGVLKDVTNNGANDVYKIVNGEGDVFLFPAVAAFLGEIDPENGVIKVRPIEGMFTHED